MKKIFALMVAAAIVFAGCSEDNEDDGIDTFPLKASGEFLVKKQGVPVGLLFLESEDAERGSHVGLVKIAGGKDIERLSVLESPDLTIYRQNDYFYLKGYNLEEEVNGQWTDIQSQITTLGIEGDEIQTYSPDVNNPVIDPPTPVNGGERDIDVADVVYPYPQHTYPLYAATDMAVPASGEDFNFTAQHIDLTDTYTYTDQLGHTYSEPVAIHFSIVAVYSFNDEADYYIVDNTVQFQNQSLPNTEYKDNTHNIDGGKGWDVRYGFGHGATIFANIKGADNTNAVLVSTHPATTQGSSGYTTGETIGFSGNVGNSGGSIGANVSFTNTQTTTTPDVSITNGSVVAQGSVRHVIDLSIADPDSHSAWARGSGWAHWQIDNPCATATSLFQPVSSWIWKVPKAQGNTSTVSFTYELRGKTKWMAGQRNIWAWWTYYEEQWVDKTYNITMNRPTRTMP